MEAFWGTNFTSSKILFYGIFWSVHIALFAGGWCVTYINILTSANNASSQVHPGSRFKTSGAKYTAIFSLDIKRIGPRLVRGCRLDIAAHVQKYPEMHQTQDSMAASG